MKNQTNETHAFLTFSLGAEKFAISVDSVQEIVELEQVTKVPTSAHSASADYWPICTSTCRSATDLLASADQACNATIDLRQGYGEVTPKLRRRRSPPRAPTPRRASALQDPLRVTHPSGCS